MYGYNRNSSIIFIFFKHLMNGTLFEHCYNNQICEVLKIPYKVNAINVRLTRITFKDFGVTRSIILSCYPEKTSFYFVTSIF